MDHDEDFDESFSEANSEADDFDYDEFIEREFGDGVQTRLAWHWKVIVLVLLGGFLLTIVAPLL